MTSRPLKRHSIGLAPAAFLDHLRAHRIRDLGLCGTPAPADRMEVDATLVTCNSCRAILARSIGRHADGYFRAIEALIAAHPDEWTDLLEAELVIATLRM